MATKTINAENITPEMVTAFFEYRGIGDFPIGLLKKVLEVAPVVEMQIVPPDIIAKVEALIIADGAMGVTDEQRVFHNVTVRRVLAILRREK